MLYINFVEGVNIPVFMPSPAYIKDVEANSIYNEVLTNAIIAMASKGNDYYGEWTFQKQNIWGKKLHDLAGREWHFYLENPTTLKLKISSGETVLTTFTIPAVYNGQGTYSYLAGNETPNGLEIRVVTCIPANFYRITTSTIFVNYIDGKCDVSPEYTDDFSDRKDEMFHLVVDSEISGTPYENTRLTNKRYDLNGFVSAETVIYRPINSVYSEAGYYLGVNTATTTSYESVTISDNQTIIDNEGNPYINGDTAGTGGGGGLYDNTSDPVDIPEVPAVAASDTGMITLFNPTLAQLHALSNYLWSDLFDLDNIKKLFADPMDAILGLSIVPVAVPNGSPKTVKVSGIATDVTMLTCATQYVEVNCGSINIEEYFGAYLDYSPYTRAELYLPYVGTHPINVDDIMGKTVTVKYHVDILSGACVAYVKCGESVLYTFSGACASNIPVTGNSWTNVINGALNIAGSIGSMIATHGATAPQALGTIVNTAANSLKPSIERSGAISGTAGLLNIQIPYIIITRPRQSVPTNLQHFTGFPSNITVNLSTLRGYTEIDKIHIENVRATSEELDELERILKEGVIF